MKAGYTLKTKQHYKKKERKESANSPIYDLT